MSVPGKLSVLYKCRSWQAGLMALTLIFPGAWAADEMVPETSADLPAFSAPQRHPRDRYEQGWNKNPFTLKTAPVIEEKQSFAKDLVLLNAYRIMDITTVVLVNSKTLETTRLKSNEPGPNGMKLRQVQIQDSRKDSFVEVELNGEVAVLRQDEAVRKQMLARNAKAAPAPDAKDKTTAQQPAQDTPPRAPGTPGVAAAGPTHPTPNPSAARPGPTTMAQTRPPGAVPPTAGPRPTPLPPQGTPSPQTRRISTAPTSIRPKPGPPPQ